MEVGFPNLGKCPCFHGRDGRLTREGSLCLGPCPSSLFTCPRALLPESGREAVSSTLLALVTPALRRCRADLTWSRRCSRQEKPNRTPTGVQTPARHQKPGKIAGPGPNCRKDDPVVDLKERQMSSAAVGLEGDMSLELASLRQLHTVETRMLEGSDLNQKPWAHPKAARSCKTQKQTVAPITPGPGQCAKKGGRGGALRTLGACMELHLSCREASVFMQGQVTIYGSYAGVSKIRGSNSKTQIVGGLFLKGHPGNGPPVYGSSHGSYAWRLQVFTER